MNTRNENRAPARVAKVKRTGCSFCRHPLYAGTVCKNCGSGAKQSHQHGHLRANIRHLAKWMLITIGVLVGTVAVAVIHGVLA